MHDYISKLQNLNLSSDTSITLTYTDGCEVFHYKDGGGVEEAISNTNTIRRFSDLVEELQGNFEDGWHTILLSLEDSYVLTLSDFEQEHSEGEDIHYNITTDDIYDAIRDNFWDQEYIESNVKKYDHKRGYCDLTATVVLSVEELLKVQPELYGWKIEVETENGLLTIEG